MPSAVATPSPAAEVAAFEIPTFEVVQNWPYVMGIVPTDEKILKIDVYQRPLTTFVEKIVKEWKGALLLPICVSERTPGKLYAVVDGQTRAEAMRRLGMPHAPALIYRGLTLAQESRLFSQIMTERKGMNPATRFNADVIAGDERAVALTEVLTDYGFFVDHNSPDKGAIKAVAALEYILRGCKSDTATNTTCDPGAVATVLQVLREGFPDLSDTAKHGDMLRGLGKYLQEHPNVDLDKLTKQLRKVTPGTILKRAANLREGEDARSAIPPFVARAIHNQYKSTAR